MVCLPAVSRQNPSSEQKHFEGDETSHQPNKNSAYKKNDEIQDDSVFSPSQRDRAGDKRILQSPTGMLLTKALNTSTSMYTELDGIENERKNTPERRELLSDCLNSLF